MLYLLIILNVNVTEIKDIIIVLNINTSVGITGNINSGPSYGIP